jgi:hypothetical protein
MNNPIELKMDEANIRTVQGLKNFNGSLQLDLHVKQKYMGHRNARWDFSVFKNFLLDYSEIIVSI